MREWFWHCAGVLALTLGTLTILAASSTSLAHAEECPNAAYRTGFSSRLPDCRAFELVSPVFTDTGAPGVKGAGVGPSGSTVMLEISNGSVEGLEGYTNATFPLSIAKASRTASGWVTVGEALPASEYEAAEFDFDGGVGLDAQTNALLGRRTTEPANQLNLYLRHSDRSLAEVGPILPPTVLTGTAEQLAFRGGASVDGNSDDMSHVIFQLKSGFWPFDDTEERASESLYEYVGVGNTQPMLVGVSDGSTAVDGETLPAGRLISECGTIPGGYEHNQNAVSADGDTVIFTAEPQHGGCERSAPPVAELFARVDNGLADARTVSISQPAEEDCAACYENKKLISAGQLADAEFVGASEDGSKVFFTTKQPLLGGDASGNLYEYDFDAPAGERLVRASAGDGTASSAAAGVAVFVQSAKGLHPVVSLDGSHVYFSATGVLTRTPNGEGESAEAGAPNLYVFERDASYPRGHIAFVAQMPVGENISPRVAPEIQTTPDGRFAVFTSRRDLTPDDTTAAQQVFEYDAQTGGLTRVSIGEHGYNHNGSVPLQIEIPLIEQDGVIEHGEEFSLDDASLTFGGGTGFGTSNQSRAADSAAGPDDYSTHLSVSADGSYVFFMSQIALTPLADNDVVIGYTPEGNLPGLPIYAKNIYEYHDGRVSLIADGKVNLVGTDPSGQDLFLSSAERLVTQDTASNVAVFDARVDGGFPAQTGAPPCSGEECQGALSGAPTLLSPGSEFQAGGNPPLAVPALSPVVSPKAKGCKRGYVKKKGKCVKKRKAKRSSRGKGRK